ncbi:MAG: TVP38/TMEM64 family protein [Alphaproteobacteria bacterium]|nr:TVP38/TMEM64 family protein [Alphaproteobacteria bacterium]
MSKSRWRFLPLAVLLGGLVAFFALGLDRHVGFQTLKDNREWLAGRIADHPILAPLAYMALYVVTVAFSLPGGAVLTVTGGFLFGALAATGMVVAAATLGATLLFLAARTALGDILRNRAGPMLARMEEGFKANALSYLLVLRLVPVFPFFIVNLAPAFLGVPLRTYILGTFLGIIPGTYVFASVGAGLGSIFDSGESFRPENALTQDVIIALCGLAVLALIPVVYRRITGPSGQR